MKKLKLHKDAKKIEELYNYLFTDAELKKKTKLR